MKQLTVGELKKQLGGIADDLPVFFRRIAPLCGNLEEAGAATVDSYAFFGQTSPCIIIEPRSE